MTVPGWLRCVLVVLSVGGLPACAAGSPAHDGGTAASASAPAPSTDPSPSAAYVRTRTAVGNQPCGVVASGATVWVSDYVEGTVRPVDAGTGVVGAPVEVGVHPCGLALGAGSLWVEDFGSDDVARIDLATRKVVATVKVGHQPYDVAFLAGAAWLTDYADGTVSRVDARTGRRTVVRTGGTPIGIAPSAGALWVGLGDGTVARIDPARSVVTARVHVGGGSSWTAYDASSVWVSDPADGAVVQVDARTARVVRTARVGGTPQDGDVGGGGVWVPDKDGSLRRIDVRTGAVTGPWPTTVGNPFVLASDGSRLWTADFAGTDLVSIDPSGLPAG